MGKSSVEVQSQSDSQLREEILRLIIRKMVRPIIQMWSHLDREVITGLIGPRGDGKSGTGASISVTNFMVRGIPVYSNMPISCDIEVDDEIAQKYGLNRGGIVHYESKPLDAEALVQFDDMFRDSCIYADEINKVLSNSRRFMSNTNLWFNNVSEQLRKLHASLIYTVINEMSVDPELRYLTDLFIRCEDTAISPEGLVKQSPAGMNFKLTWYPMSRIINGKSYYQTHKSLVPMYFDFGRFRGIYDDKLPQAAGKLKYGLDIDLNKIRWAWLKPKTDELRKHLKELGETEIYDYELWQFLGLAERGLAPHVVGRHLPAYGIIKSYQAGGDGNRRWVYEIKDVDEVNGVRNGK